MFRNVKNLLLGSIALAGLGTLLSPAFADAGAYTEWELKILKRYPKAFSKCGSVDTHCRMAIVSANQSTFIKGGILKAHEISGIMQSYREKASKEASIRSTSGAAGASTTSTDGGPAYCHPSGFGCTPPAKNLSQNQTNALEEFRASIKNCGFGDIDCLQMYRDKILADRKAKGTVTGNALVALDEAMRGDESVQAIINAKFQNRCDPSTQVNCPGTAYSDLEKKVMEAAPGIFKECGTAADVLSCRQSAVGKNSDILKGKGFTAGDLAKLGDQYGSRKFANQKASADAQANGGYTGPNCAANPSHPLCAEASQWNAPPEVETTPEQLCASVEEMREKKTKDAIWANNMCPAALQDTDKLKRLNAKQQNACRMWYNATNGTLYKDLCAAKVTSNKTWKWLGALAGLNVGMYVLCNVELAKMVTAAKITEQNYQKYLADKAAAAAAGTSVPVPNIAGKAFLMGAKKFRAICAYSALGAVAAEGAVALHLAKVNGKNFFTMGASAPTSGKIDTKSYSNPEQAIKAVATAASLGINAVVLVKAIELIKSKKQCGLDEMLRINDSIEANNSAQLIAANRKCSFMFRDAKSLHSQGRTVTTFTHFSPNRYAHIAPDDRTEGGISRLFAVRAQDETLLQILIAQGMNPNPKEISDDPVTKEVIQTVIDELQSRIES